MFFCRETGAPKHGYGSVLPRHNPDYNKHYLDSTHRADFKPPNPNYVPVPVSLVVLCYCFMTKSDS